MYSTHLTFSKWFKFVFLCVCVVVRLFTCFFFFSLLFSCLLASNIFEKFGAVTNLHNRNYSNTKGVYNINGTQRIKHILSEMEIK